MAKTVIATVKTDKQNIIDGVNREKLVLGSASEVCERALFAYFDSAAKQNNFSINDVEENRNCIISIHVNANDLSSLHEISLQNGLLTPDLCSIVLSRFVRGEIYFHELPQNPENQPFTAVNQPENQLITQEIENENQPITQENEPVNDNQETVIIKLSDLGLNDVKDSLLKNGFDELRYYTPKKEQQTNHQFSRVIQEIKTEHKEETDYLQQKIDGLQTTDSDVNQLIDSTKIIIETLEGVGKNPFTRYKKKDILAIFPEKLRPIFEL